MLLAKNGEQLSTHSPNPFDEPIDDEHEAHLVELAPADEADAVAGRARSERFAQQDGVERRRLEARRRDLREQAEAFDVAWQLDWAVLQDELDAQGVGEERERRSGAARPAVGRQAAVKVEPPSTDAATPRAAGHLVTASAATPRGFILSATVEQFPYPRPPTEGLTPHNVTAWGLKYSAYAGRSVCPSVRSAATTTTRQPMVIGGFRRRTRIKWRTPMLLTLMTPLMLLTLRKSYVEPINIRSP